MKKNIGRVDAMMRISAGLTLLAWSTAKMAKKEPTGGQLFLAFMGAQKVAEGATRYCPMTHALGLQKKKEKQKQVQNPMQKPLTM